MKESLELEGRVWRALSIENDCKLQVLMFPSDIHLLEFYFTILISGRSQLVPFW